MSIAQLIVLCVHNEDMLHSFSLVTGSLKMIWPSLLSRLPLVISIAITTSSQFPRHKSLVIFKFFLLCFPCPVCHHILFEITFTSFLTRIALQEYGWNMATNSLISSPLVVSLFRYTWYMDSTAFSKFSAGIILPFENYSSPNLRVWVLKF